MWLIPLFMVIVYCQSMAVIDIASFEWREFKLEHGKHYESDTEEEFRMKIFLENKHKIEKHNAEYELGMHTFKLGMNRFGDLLTHEISQMMNGFNLNETDLKMEGSTFITPANVMIPDKIDWREKGAVSHVKDQHKCACCYAFSANGAMEAQHFLKTGVLISLSEQNVIDCSYETHGCTSGKMIYVYDYVRQNGGIDSEESYPYEAVKRDCRYNPKNVGATNSGYVTLPSEDENKLKEAVATKGPISVGLDSKGYQFHFYKEGIYCNDECSAVQLSHAALVVGYGTDGSSKQDYWIVKNSWGEKWGENGYIRMCRNHNNNCGIATNPTYPLV